MKNKVASAERFFPDGMAFTITRRSKDSCDPVGYSHLGSRLREKLETHHWHLVRSTFGKDPQPELQPEYFTYEAVIADAEVVTPRRICKLLGKAWDVLQIMWPNRQSGIEFATDGNGYYIATPNQDRLHARATRVSKAI